MRGATSRALEFRRIRPRSSSVSDRAGRRQLDCFGSLTEDLTPVATLGDVPDTHTLEPRIQHVFVVARALDPGLHHVGWAALALRDVLAVGGGTAEFCAVPGQHDTVLFSLV